MGDVRRLILASSSHLSVHSAATCPKYQLWAEKVVHEVTGPNRSNQCLTKYFHFIMLFPFLSHVPLHFSSNCHF